MKVRELLKSLQSRTKIHIITTPYTDDEFICENPEQAIINYGHESVKKRIEFETVSNYNIDSDRTKKIIAERDAVPKKRSSKNLNKIAKLNEEIGKLTKGIADIIYAECEIYDKNSVGCAATAIENLIRKE